MQFFVSRNIDVSTMVASIAHRLNQKTLIQMALLSKEMDLEGNVNDINDDRDTDSSRNILKLYN
jgi:hypothetical protein